MSISFTENILLPVRSVIHVMPVGVGLAGVLVEYWCTYFVISYRYKYQHETLEQVYMVATSVNGFVH